MSQAATRPNPIWTIVLGVISILLTLEFWFHLLVPLLRTRVRFPFWPTGAFIELLASAFLAALAAIRGARTWWIVVACACASLCFLLFMFSG